MSEYVIYCECGKQLFVSPRQAGSQVDCTCGRFVKVPNLSALKKSAGESVQTTIEHIETMLRKGELPYGDVCPVSGRRTDDSIYFHVQCERVWVRGGDSVNYGKVIAYYLLFGWIGAFIASKNMEPLQELGRDTHITIPLRISSEVRSKLLRTRHQKALKSLLKQVPVYAKLLQEYPNAVVTPDQSV